jgi:hypothetical protein
VVSTSGHLAYKFFILQGWSVGSDAVSFLRPGLKFVYQLIYFFISKNWGTGIPIAEVDVTLLLNDEQKQ